MDLIILLETYLHECFFLVSFDRLVVNRCDCIKDAFGNIGVEMRFTGINRFIGTQTKMFSMSSSVTCCLMQNHQLLLIGQAILFLFVFIYTRKFLA
jgi:hypothetical protein